MRTKRAFHHFSIWHRFFVTASLWLGGTLLLAGLLIPKLVDDYLIEDEKSQLNLAMDELIANISVNKEGKLYLPAKLSDPRFKQPYSGHYWTLSTHSQQLRSRSLWDKTLTKNTDKQFDRWQGAKGESLTVVQQQIFIPESRSPINITVAMDEAPRLHTLAGVKQQLWLILAVLFIVLLLLLVWQVNWSLRPLTRLQKELKALREGAQDQVHGLYPQEVSPLIHDLNALIFHYHELLQRARHHGGNLSHSLKTPLSIIKNQANNLPPEQQSQFHDAIQQAQQQIDYHLSRSRMAGAMNILAVKSEPCARLDAIIKAFDKVYAERLLTVVNELEQSLLVSVDENDLDEMLGNLLENAYKWANSLVRVYSELNGTTLIIIIDDDGPGIQANLLPKITQRGYRLDESSKGSGIGLNIVADIAHSYRGEIQFNASESGGLKALLSLPLNRNKA